MPAQSIPFVALVVVSFAAFIVALGVVSLRQAMAERQARRAARAARPAPVVAVFPKTDSKSLARAA